MKCPICGAKMPQKIACPYCRITGQQVLDASNKKAKECLRNGEKEKVHTSTCVPKDVNYTKMLLYSIFLGFLGVNSFYVGKRFKGIFMPISFILAVIFHMIKQYFWQGSTIIYYISELFLWIEAFCVLMWIGDIFAVIFRYYKYPVVLPESDDKNLPKIKTRSVKHG